MSILSPMPNPKAKKAAKKRPAAKASASLDPKTVHERAAALEEKATKAEARAAKLRQRADRTRARSQKLQGKAGNKGK